MTDRRGQLSEKLAAGRRRAESTFVARTWRRAEEYRLATHVMVLSAQQMLCVAPLAVALFAVARHRGIRGDLGQVIARMLGLDEAATADVVALFAGAHPTGTWDLVIGLVITVLSATGAAHAQQRGFELMWGLTERRGLRSWLGQLAWTCGMALYLIILSNAGRPFFLMGAGRGSAGLIIGSAVIQFSATFLFYWWSQRILLGSRVAWRSLLPGAVVITVATMLLVRASGPILSSQIVEQVGDYGYIAGAFILALWLMALSAVIFCGTLAGMLIEESRVGPDHPEEEMK